MSFMSITIPRIMLVMKITKYEHSCLDIFEGNTRIIIDAGVFSKSCADFSNVAAVVVTHIHPDHFDPDKLDKIVSANPSVQIFTTAEVAKEFSKNVKVAEEGKPYKVGDITLEFFGKEHAKISPDYPAAQNIGLLVNDKLFYPGDSFTQCPKPYKVLAVPTMAPWLKFSETADYLKAASGKIVFPSHDWFINADGQALYDRLIGAACQQLGKEYKFIAPGESLEV